ncbi:MULTISPECIES: hypothetical protein [Pontibacillus]|uniref:Uncharacterized protein n=1 Tax=Pontibacillus salipaludis TaxID=1697394 RepID=A0ABQ1QHR2_9BACI|nr:MULTISPECIES: hypothetical protein [Pontibacillus]QSS98821.1 hypothetical protein IMZ31_11975 [Pontibacillus sp. ALD_SL1]GGD25378.1 hypothetical protein GCM10011389_36300 [Pontibacillus salipaludis]
MSQKGPSKHNQKTAEIAKKNKKYEAELAEDMQKGNSKHQSQKKSGRQANKK